MSASDFDDLLRVTLDLQHQLAETQHNATNLIRQGVVEKTDGKKGYQIKFAEDGGKAVPSPWFPHPEQGGAFKTWRPLTKGQNVCVICPGGDPKLAHIIPRGGFSDQNKAPSDKLDENVETFGKIRSTWKEKSTEKKIGEKVTITTTDESRTTQTQGAKHYIGPSHIEAVAAGSVHKVEPSQIMADTNLFRATRKAILASG